MHAHACAGSLSLVFFIILLDVGADLAVLVAPCHYEHD